MENTVKSTDMGNTKEGFVINIVNLEMLRTAKLSGKEDEPEQWSQGDLENTYVNNRLDTVTLEMFNHNNKIYYRYSILYTPNTYLQIMELDEQEEITDKINLEDLAETLKNSEDVVRLNNNTFEFEVKQKLVTISELKQTHGNSKIIQVLFCETI